jgi:hypothetical protein
MLRRSSGSQSPELYCQCTESLGVTQSPELYPLTLANPKARGQDNAIMYDMAGNQEKAIAMVPPS